MEEYLLKIHPAILVTTIYLAVLLPTYLLLKKYKPTYWWMVLGLFGEIVIINSINYALIFITKGEDFFVFFFAFGSLSSLILYIVLPIVLIGYRTKEKVKGALMAYLFSILGFIIICIKFYHLIAFSMQAWIKYFN